MSHPMKNEAVKAKADRLSNMIGGKAAAKAVHKHEVRLHSKETPTKFRANGGSVDGDMPKARGDKASRKSGNTVNVIVSAAPKPPMPLPVPVPAGGPGPMAGPPGGVPMPPPGAGPVGPVPPMMARKRGGGVKEEAGAGSGLGRIEKAKANAKAARTVAPQNRNKGGKC